jgi:hypothetical protein
VDSTALLVILIVLFVGLDAVFLYLITRRMGRPSPSIAFARSRGLAEIADGEGEGLGRKLRESLGVPHGEMYDIVRLPIAGVEAYLYSTLPERSSSYRRAAENRRQFIAVLMPLPIAGRLLIHPPIRPPLRGFKRRRLYRVFKAEDFGPVPGGALPAGIGRVFTVAAEGHRGGAGAPLSPRTVDPLRTGPRARGFAIVLSPRGFVVYVNPVFTREKEVGPFVDFAEGLARAFATGK